MLLYLKSGQWGSDWVLTGLQKSPSITLRNDSTEAALMYPYTTDVAHWLAEGDVRLGLWHGVLFMLHGKQAGRRVCGLTGNAVCSQDTDKHTFRSEHKRQPYLRQTQADRHICSALIARDKTSFSVSVPLSLTLSDTHMEMSAHTHGDVPLCFEGLSSIF